MARSSIMGFTEAELGFVLAAVFIAMAGHEISERRVITASTVIPVASPVTSTDTLVAENKRLKATLDSLKRLSSKLTPPCTERGEPNASVARLFIRSATTYVLGGEALTVAGVRERLKSHIERSARLGCRYYIDAVPDAALSAHNLIRATRPLEGTFYVRRVF